MHPPFHKNLFLTTQKNVYLIHTMRFVNDGTGGDWRPSGNLLRWVSGGSPDKKGTKSGVDTAVNCFWSFWQKPTSADFRWVYGRSLAAISLMDHKVYSEIIFELRSKMDQSWLNWFLTYKKFCQLLVIEQGYIFWIILVILVRLGQKLRFFFVLFKFPDL